MGRQVAIPCQERILSLFYSFNEWFENHLRWTFSLWSCDRNFKSYSQREKNKCSLHFPLWFANIIAQKIWASAPGGGGKELPLFWVRQDHLPVFSLLFRPVKVNYSPEIRQSPPTSSVRNGRSHPWWCSEYFRLLSELSPRPCSDSPGWSPLSPGAASVSDFMVGGKALEILGLARPQPLWAGNAMQSQFLFFQAIKAGEGGGRAMGQVSQVRTKPWLQSRAASPSSSSKNHLFSRIQQKVTLAQSRVESCWIVDCQASSQTQDPNLELQGFLDTWPRLSDLWTPRGIRDVRTTNRSCLIWETPTPKFHLQVEIKASSDEEFPTEVGSIPSTWSQLKMKLLNWDSPLERGHRWRTSVHLTPPRSDTELVRAGRSIFHSQHRNDIPCPSPKVLIFFPASPFNCPLFSSCN